MCLAVQTRSLQRDPASRAIHAHSIQFRNTLLQCRMVTELTNSVTKYFDSDGLLLEDAFRQDVRKKLQQYTATSKKRQ